MLSVKMRLTKAICRNQVKFGDDAEKLVSDGRLGGGPDAENCGYSTVAILGQGERARCCERQERQ